MCLLMPDAQQSIPLRTEIAELFGKLQENGHEVIAIISSKRDKNYIWRGMRIYEVKNKGRVRKLLMANTIVKAKDCNIIIAKNSSVDGIIGLYLKWKLKKPFVFQYTWPGLQGWLETVKLQNRKRLSSELINRIDDFLQVKIMCRANLVIATSPLMKKYLITRGVKENRTIPFPNGVNRSLFSNINSNCIRSKYKLEAMRIIIYVGTMDKLRQLDFLIQIFKKVKDKLEKTKLLMVGDGNDKHRLEEIAAKLKIEQDVIFTGTIPYFEVSSYIASADVAVSVIPPSLLYKLSSPLKIFEYMGAGKPVVANQEIPEQGEVIRKSRGGVAVEYSETAFAEAIIQLLSDRNKREEMGKNGQKWVFKNRSYEKLSNDLEVKLSQLITKDKMDC